MVLSDILNLKYQNTYVLIKNLKNQPQIKLY